MNTHTAPQFGTRPQLDGLDVLTTITPCPECIADQLATIGGTAPRLLALPGETVAFCVATHGYVNTPAEVLADGQWMPVTEVTVGMHVATGERIERIKATAKQIHIVTVHPKFGDVVERKAKDQQTFVYPTTTTIGL